MEKILKDYKVYGPYMSKSKRESVRRYFVILISPSGQKTTMSYSRYLMTEHLDRFLTENEEVDHINNDKFDDRIENLQVLTKEKHLEKTLKETPRRKTARTVILNCNFCGKEFEVKETIWKRKNTKYCSRRCTVKNQHKTNRNGGRKEKYTHLYPKVIEMFKKGIPKKRIAISLGMSRSTVRDIIKKLDKK